MAGMLDDRDGVFDLVGIGFGPSNLAVAVALHETDECEWAGIRFLERKSSFSWHEDMLLDGARMQVSFLKDLATMRNPSSRFTFLNYLQQSGRLSKFANLKTFYPSRREFNDYMQWVARQLGDVVQYGAHVRSIEPIEEGSQIQLLRVDYTDGSGQPCSLLTRDALFSTGPRPRLPFSLEESLRSITFHSSEFLSRLSQIKMRDGIRFLVVGGGRARSNVRCISIPHLSVRTLRSPREATRYGPWTTVVLLTKYFYRKRLPYGTAWIRKPGPSSFGSTDIPIMLVPTGIC